MSSKNPVDCLHMMLERVKQENVHPVLDLNGHGQLVPHFKCGDCGQVFYAISAGPTQKPDKAI